jgi:hypothetical protein
VSVTVANAVAPPVVDSMAASNGVNKRTVQITTAAPGDVLVAFAASEGPASANSQAMTVSGAGLAWTRVQRAAVRQGVAEIWTATAATTLSSASISATQQVSGYRDSLVVVAFKGASGVGASASGGAANGAYMSGVLNAPR